jgi:mitogen-activated protein kinase 15
MTEFIATRWYRAPEVLLGSRSYSAKSDMWSLGCLIYELYSRRTLLPGENTIDQITKIIEFKGVPTPEEIDSFKSPKSSEILSFFKVQRHPP